MKSLTFDLLIRNAALGAQPGRPIVDIGIRDGKIVALGALDDQPHAEALDARGLVAIPGLIDTQVHFREPGLEHKEDLETGTMAAIAGGVTTVFEMPNTVPPTTSKEALDDKLRRCVGRAWCDHAFFVGASAENVGRLSEYELLPGTPGIKIFMGSSTGSLLVGDDPTLEKVLLAGSHRVAVHAEDEPRNAERKKLLSASPHPSEHPFLRDAESARLATSRLLELSARTKRPVHVLHVSAKDELPLIERAKKEGLKNTAEVTPQHLYFHAPDCYERLGSLAQMNPPIRSEEHRQALWKALHAGLFDVFGSDHAPHTIEEKGKPYPSSPSGLPGVQTMLPVLLTFVNQGLLDLPTVVRMACENPACIYGIAAKGQLAVGYDADLVLLDMDRKIQVTDSMMASKCGWTPYVGETLVGWPEIVLLRGKMMVRNERFVGRPEGRPATFLWK